jgi:hypothetical protein
MTIAQDHFLLWLNQEENIHILGKKSYTQFIKEILEDEVEAFLVEKNLSMESEDSKQG